MGGGGSVVQPQRRARASARYVPARASSLSRSGSGAGPRAGISSHAAIGPERKHDRAVQRWLDVRKGSRNGERRGEGATVAAEGCGQGGSGRPRAIEVTIGVVAYGRGNGARLGDVGGQAGERARGAGDELRKGRPSRSGRRSTRCRADRRLVQVEAALGTAQAVRLRPTAWRYKARHVRQDGLKCRKD